MFDYTGIIIFLAALSIISFILKKKGKSPIFILSIVFVIMLVTPFLPYKIQKKGKHR